MMKPFRHLNVALVDRFGVWLHVSTLDKYDSRFNESMPSYMLMAQCFYILRGLGLHLRSGERCKAA
jgi:hypothetical protein